MTAPKLTSWLHHPHQLLKSHVWVGGRQQEAATFKITGEQSSRKVAWGVTPATWGWKSLKSHFNLLLFISSKATMAVGKAQELFIGECHLLLTVTWEGSTFPRDFED